MAQLVPCPDCGQPMSSRALTVCPHCGFRRMLPLPVRLLVGGLFGVGVAFLAYAFIQAFRLLS
jgi:hypothetical protein